MFKRTQAKWTQQIIVDRVQMVDDIREISLRFQFKVKRNQNQQTHPKSWSAQLSENIIDARFDFDPIWYRWRKTKPKETCKIGCATHKRFWLRAFASILLKFQHLLQPFHDTILFASLFCYRSISVSCVIYLMSFVWAYWKWVR